MKQLQWFQSALTKKQSELENQVKQKRKLEQSVMEMTKKQAELTSDTLHRVDMTMRRSVRPSSASSHNSRRYNIGVTSSGGMGRRGAGSSTRSFRNNTSSGKI